MPPAAVLAAGAIGTAAIGANSAKNAQRSAEDAARQQQEAAFAEQRRLEEKFGLTPGDLERQDRTLALEKERQSALQQRAGLSGEQLLRQQGPITDQLLNEINARQGLTGEQLFTREGGINQQLVNSISNFDEQAFAPELALTLQAVNQQANRRGVYGGLPEGGIRFEQLGRAGVDLAVRKATERLNQQQALAQAFANLSTGARGEAASVGQSALGQSQGARDELSNFLVNLQQLDAQSKGRAAQAALQGSGQAQQTANMFGTVPINFAAQQYGAGQGMQSQALAGLGNLGGKMLDQLFEPKTNTPSTVTSIGDITNTSQGRVPLTSALFERVGGLPGWAF